MTPERKLTYDFALFSYHVRGVILSSLLMGDRLHPKIKNNWKLMYSRLVTDANNFEKEMNKVLGEGNVDKIEDMDAFTFQMVEKAFRLEREDFFRFKEYIENWK
jgi:hypothetical protein